MQDSWIIWAVIGIACIGLEMLMPGFVIFFFGLGALATAALTLIPSVGSQVWLQILLFSGLSVLSLMFLRRRFTRIFEGTLFIPGTSASAEDGAGETCEVVETVGTVKEGRIRFRGTTWNARSVDAEIQAGSRARILERDGMMYKVESLASGENTRK